MNFEEGKRFVRELLIAFPAFDDAARSSPDLGKTHCSWIDAWDDLTYLECQRALSGLVKRGEIGYEDYRGPGPFIRRLVLQNRKNAPKSESELAGREKTRREIEAQRKAYQGSPMAYALLEMRRLNELGVPEFEILGAGELILEGKYVQRHFSARAS